jgi:hypothetical protein
VQVPANDSSVLNEHEARTLATTLANNEFAKRNINASLHPSSWSIVKKDSGRWLLVKVSPAGTQAWVSFDLDGANVTVKVEYALE